MRAAKGYLASHCSWFEENPDTCCPRCGREPESFEHVISTHLTCSRARDQPLKEVASLRPIAALWTLPLLTQALSQYISNTRTGFPRDMTQNVWPSLTPCPPTCNDFITRRGLLFFIVCVCLFIHPPHVSPCAKCEGMVSCYFPYI